MHQSLFHILKSKTNTKVEEIFLTEQHNGDTSKKIAEIMLQLYGQSDPETFKNSLSEFYNTPIHKAKDWIQKFEGATQYPLNGHPTVEEHLDWCSRKGILSTPRIFYNGRPLPDEYSFDDLDYLID